MKVRLAGRPEGNLTVQHIEPFYEYANNRKTNKQRRDASGTPVWRISCLLTCDDKRPEIVNVKVACDDFPPFELGQSLDCPFIVVPYVKGDRVAYSFTIADISRALKHKDE